MLDEDRRPHADVLAALPVFPLPNAVLLPGMVLPLNVFEPRYLEMVDHVVEQGGHLGIPLLRPGFEACYEQRPEFERVFGIGRLVSHQELPDGRRFIRVEGLGRARLLEELPARTSFRELRVDLLSEGTPTDEHQLQVLRAQLERIAATLDADELQMVESVLRIPDRRLMLYAVTAIMPTLGFWAHGDRQTRGRPALLELQQQCLAIEDADGRVGALIECAAEVCDALGSSGAFPQRMWN